MDFDELKCFFNKSRYPNIADEELFTVIRYLSLVPESFHVAKSAAMFFGRISPAMLIKHIYYSIPVQRVPWFDYIKGSKKKKRDKLIDPISKYFNCSYKHAEEILLIFNRNLIDLYPIFGLKKVKQK